MTSKNSQTKACTVIQQLRRKMERKGMSNRRAAEEIGVSAMTVGSWLNGENRPHPSNVRKIENFVSEQTYPCDVGANQQTGRYEMEFTACPACGKDANNSVMYSSKWYCPYCDDYFPRGQRA